MIEFWFDFASTYSYLSALSIGARAGEQGARVAWRPFLLGPIFKAQGWSSSPFNIYPAKGRYMWRDMERLCADAGLALLRPEPFPQNSLLAARIGVAARDQVWLPDYCRGVFMAEFARGETISSPDVLGGILTGIGVDAQMWLDRAVLPATKQALRQRTEAAAAHGIFGAPSFLAGGELFWGHDRMRQALGAL
jgi:2-hydroxychromene-2-carboxylate isomerase